MDRVGHGSETPLTQRIDLEGCSTGLKPSPVFTQFDFVDLGPSFDEPSLPRRQATSEKLDRIDGVDRCRVLVVRVEVWAMVLGGRFREHADDDPEEAGDLRHEP